MRAVRCGGICCNPYIWEGEAGGPGVHRQSQLHNEVCGLFKLHETLSQYDNA